MSDPVLPPTSRRTVPRAARVLVPVGAVALAFGGFAIAQAATDSGTDTPHDLAERGLDATNPPVDDDTPPATNEANPVSSAAATETATFDTVNLPDGSTQTFPAGAAGTVTIGRNGTTLSVIAVGTNPGWTAAIAQASGPEVEVEFRNGTARIDLEAELEEGAVGVRVRERTGAENDDDAVTPPTTRVDNSGPGSVNSGHDGDEAGDDDGADHEVGDDSGSHSGSGSSDSGSSGHSGSGSSESGSSGSGSGHSGSDD